MPHLVTRGMAFGLHVSYEVPSVSIRGLHLCRQCPLKLKLESSMAPVPITEDYYLMLEVEQTATSELIARSYKRLALKLHPASTMLPKLFNWYGNLRLQSNSRIRGYGVC
jgi:hypothetical protein